MTASASRPDVADVITPLSDLMSVAVVDGVPVLLAARPGPVTGGIFFRVGQADETLSTSGLTHLIEHLALHGEDLADQHSNGQTAEAWTLFHKTGRIDDVVPFLRRVCERLSDLPFERLEVEKEILRTEAERRGGGAAQAMRAWRYGYQGPGLVAHDELGLFRVTAADAAEWAQTWFTSGNAVAFLTVDTLPDTLTLPLRLGERRPVQASPQYLPDKPAWFHGARDGVMIDAVVERSTAATTFAGVLTRILLRELRGEQALSYSAGCEYEPINGRHARLTVHADALADKAGAVVGAVTDAIAALRAGVLDPKDLEATRQQAAQFNDDPHIGAAMLPSAALNVLLGHELLHPDSVQAERDALEPADIIDVAQAFWSDALAQVPTGHNWAGAAPAPQWSDSAVVGATYVHLGQDGVNLIVGDDGVTRQTADGATTVLFADCVGLGGVADGGRRIYGADGFSIPIEPTMYRGLTNEIIEQTIDSKIAADLVIPFPARDAGEIPQPPAKPSMSERLARRASDGGSALGSSVPGAMSKLLTPVIWLSFVLMFITVTLSLFTSGVAMLATLLSSSAAREGWTSAGLWWAITLVVSLPALVTIWNGRRTRE